MYLLILRGMIQHFDFIVGGLENIPNAIGWGWWLKHNPDTVALVGHHVMYPIVWVSNYLT